MELVEIPNTYLILILLISLMTLRFFGIDSFVTAGLSATIAYILGKHVEQCKQGDV